LISPLLFVSLRAPIPALLRDKTLSLMVVRPCRRCNKARDTNKIQLELQKLPLENEENTVSNQYDIDSQNLDALGYKQELKRNLSVWGNFAVGFTYLSPVVAVYSVFGYVLGTGGPAMIWALVIAGIGQLLVALVYG